MSDPNGALPPVPVFNIVFKKRNERDESTEGAGWGSVPLSEWQRQRRNELDGKPTAGQIDGVL